MKGPGGAAKEGQARGRAAARIRSGQSTYQAVLPPAFPPLGADTNGGNRKGSVRFDLRSRNPIRGPSSFAPRPVTQRAWPQSGAISRRTQGERVARKREPLDAGKPAAGEEKFLETRVSQDRKLPGGRRKKTLGGPVTFLRLGPTLYMTRTTYTPKFWVWTFNANERVPSRGRCRRCWSGSVHHSQCICCEVGSNHSSLVVLMVLISLRVSASHGLAPVQTRSSQRRSRLAGSAQATSSHQPLPMPERCLLWCELPPLLPPPAAASDYSNVLARSVTHTPRFQHKRDRHHRKRCVGGVA